MFAPSLVLSITAISLCVITFALIKIGIGLSNNPDKSDS
ncbi:YnaM/YnfT family protein [Enterobacter roggenkampii]|nr:YnaM/YnfT family protein [Enterobacter roggenkampii]